MEEDDREHLVSLPVTHQTGCKHERRHNKRATGEDAVVKYPAQHEVISTLKPFQGINTTHPHLIVYWEKQPEKKK